MPSWKELGLPGGSASDLIAAGYLKDPGYQNYLKWIDSGAQHGTLGGKVLNPNVVRSETTPWGENKQYDAQGNEVSLYMDAPPGVESPYGAPGAGPSAPGLPSGGGHSSQLQQQLAKSKYYNSGEQGWHKSSRDVEDALLALDAGGDPGLLEWLKKMGYVTDYGA